MPKIDTKYNAASNEICARIQARNRTLMSFFSLTAIILGLAVKGEGLAIIGVGSSYAAMVMVIISNYHERMIERLMLFQQELVKLDKEDIGVDWISSDFYGKTTRVRIGRDIGQLMLIIIGSTVPLLLVWDRWDSYPERYLQSYKLAVYGAIICLMIAIFLVSKNIIVKLLRKLNWINGS